MGAVVKYRSDGKDYLVLPHHFYNEGKIQYLSPTEYPRPPKEFYLKYPHYIRGLQAHMDKLQKSAQGGNLPLNLPPDPPLIKQRGSAPLIDPEGIRGGREGPKGARGLEKIRAPLEKILKKHNIPYDPLTLKPLNVSHSEKTFKRW